LEDVAKNVGLQVNEEKTVYMVMRRRDNMAALLQLKFGRYEFSRAK